MVLTARTIPRPIGNIIAAVAVFEMNAEISAVIAPKAMTVRTGDRTIQDTESTPSAIRRSRPWTVIALAMMNPPMNVKMVSLPNAPNTASALATPISTHRATANIAVAARGSASLTHQTMTRTKTPASARCGHSSPLAVTNTTAASSGPSHRPIDPRRSSNRC